MEAETITITRQRYEELLERDDWLGWLEAAGVDNWDGVSHAWEMKEEWDAENGNSTGI